MTTRRGFLAGMLASAAVAPIVLAESTTASWSVGPGFLLGEPWVDATPEQILADIEYAINQSIMADFVSLGRGDYRLPLAKHPAPMDMLRPAVSLGPTLYPEILP